MMMLSTFDNKARAAGNTGIITKEPAKSTKSQQLKSITTLSVLNDHT